MSGVKRFRALGPMMEPDDLRAGSYVLGSDYDQLAADNNRLENLSVERIMLDVVPGPDGMGAEVYAKSVADVENKLSAMGDRIEFMEDQRTRYTAENQRLREALTEIRTTSIVPRYARLQALAMREVAVEALSTTANGEVAE